MGIVLKKGTRLQLNPEALLENYLNIYDNLKKDENDKCTVLRNINLDQEAYVAVRFDKVFSQGHSCDGLCESGYGRYVPMELFSIIKNVPEDYEI